MADFARLGDQMLALERAAAVTARDLAQGLHLPTGARDGVAETAAASAAQRRVALDIATRMRRIARPLARARKSGDAETLAGLEDRLRLWGQALQAADLCLSGQEWPLFPPPRPHHDLDLAQSRILARSFTRAHRAVNTTAQDAVAEGMGYFSDIPLDAGLFVELAHLAIRICLALRRPRPLRFLDVGCGGGVKLGIAGAMFDAVCGIDFDAGYVDVARRTLRAMGVLQGDVQQADGLAYDGYGGFAVIYFFRPIIDDDALRALETRIVDAAAAGTVLIAPYDGFGPRARAMGCGSVATYVHVKGIGAGDVGALLAETRRIGPDTTSQDAALPKGIGWLRPLWTACLANGIRPG